VGGQLDAIASDLASASERVRHLTLALPPDAWVHRPGPARWSASECLAHLNLASEMALPLLRGALQDARDLRGETGTAYKRDPIGWLVWNLVEPSGRLKALTIPEWLPLERRPVETLVADFHRLQAEILACVRESEGLPIDRVKLTSPYNSRLRYNLYAALTLVPRHQHRHLLQAEQAAASCFPPATVTAGVLAQPSPSAPHH
jgi:hypothetical protein